MSSPARADADLVAAARVGDRAAFSELYERYFNRVFDFATRMMRDRDEAADVAQETFIRALERIESLHDGGRFKSWVFTIARNEALDRLRRSKRLRPLSTTDEDGVESELDVVDSSRLADPALAAEANAYAALVWEAAAGLDPRQLSILYLHLRQELTSAEIAEVLGVSKNNGYVMLNRLKAAVQSTIEAFLLFRQGGHACDDLQALISSFETDAMSPKVRRAVGAHAAECVVCSESRRQLVAPLAVMGAFAPIVPPAALSTGILQQVLERVPASGGVDELIEHEDDDDASTLVDLRSDAEASWGGESSGSDGEDLADALEELDLDL